jgi:hypothetical protein
VIAGVSALAAVLVDDAVEDPVLARRSGRYSPPMNEGCRRPSVRRSASLRVGERLGIEGGADRAAAPFAPVPGPLQALLTAFEIPILFSQFDNLEGG